MSIKISSKDITKVGFGSEPTPKSVKDRVSQIEQAIIKEMGQFTPFSDNKVLFKQILSSIQEDLKNVRPIIEYINSENGKRAFKETNIKDTYNRYQELKTFVHGQNDTVGAQANAETEIPQDIGMEQPAEGVAGEEAAAGSPAGADVAATEEPTDLGIEGAESLLNAYQNALFMKYAIDMVGANPNSNVPEGLSNKIEKLYFLGRVDKLKDIKAKVDRIIKIGQLLAKAINNDGRPTLNAISELTQACQQALTDIAVVETAVNALNQLPDKLENIVDLLKISLLERIKEIKGAE